MTDRKKALADLLEKVEAGALNVNNRHWLSVLPPHTWDCAWCAYVGSLSCVEALHNAVLHDYHYSIDSEDSGVCVYDHSFDNAQVVENGLLARAWLIAIIKALIAQED